MTTCTPRLAAASCAPLTPHLLLAARRVEAGVTGVQRDRQLLLATMRPQALGLWGSAAARRADDDEQGHTCATAQRSMLL